VEGNSRRVQWSQHLSAVVKSDTRDQSGMVLRATLRNEAEATLEIHRRAKNFIDTFIYLT
jgi:hypothetical protein